MSESNSNPSGPFGQRHLRIGWLGVLAFLTMGIALEYMLGFRVGFYMDAGNETRRLMWRLAHAHGTLLSLVNIAFGVTCLLQGGWTMRSAKWASPLLLGATLLLPGGFFLGGIGLQGTDPGIGVFLSPIGSLFLLGGVALVVRDVLARGPTPTDDSARQPADSDKPKRRKPRK